MYRSLLLFPASAGAQTVESLTAQLASWFGEQAGFRSMSTSVGPLMGPGAQDGQFASVIEIDFDSLETTLAAIEAQEFADVAAQAEALGGVILLYETREQ